MRQPYDRRRCYDTLRYCCRVAMRCHQYLAEAKAPAMERDHSHKVYDRCANAD